MAATCSGRPINGTDAGAPSRSPSPSAIKAPQPPLPAAFPILRRRHASFPSLFSSTRPATSGPSPSAAPSLRRSSALPSQSQCCAPRPPSPCERAARADTTACHSCHAQQLQPRHRKPPARLAGGVRCRASRLASRRERAAAASPWGRAGADATSSSRASATSLSCTPRPCHRTPCHVSSSNP